MRTPFPALLLAGGLAVLTACGGDDASPGPDDTPQEQGDPCAPNGHIHREPEGDWCHCNRGYLASEEGLSCVADPDYVPRTDFDFGDNGEHACWHVTNGPFATVTASPERQPRVDDFHTHYTVQLRPENGQSVGTFSFKAWASGDFILYLSTPDVAVTVKEGERVVEPMGTQATGGFCDGLKQMVGYELTDKVQYTVTFGPTANTGLGLVIEHLQ
ncbi:hypothetical protein HJC10_31170 [Corallococcus exiguus]|uniref:hypothetical protein n=1 Tax=Corallococcus TaxID=83461 RepID=UPI000ED8600B|nr:MULTISPECIES: hypothetical protein [Corallococcus]NNB88365.1 hypothetical protein [Corallococcus exiguus]NNB97913.1 hypothetical protein [Corallococcus exiguus]NNC07300.1 hypothetical protein [Corallococcus exiguus]NPC47996.1 hypothetical protein [Corallococcus exiguus]RKH79953.1 hypothetical protein D7X99_23565 [Corallococcus sp. AB032C]